MGELVDGMLDVIGATPRPLYFTEVAEYYDPFTDGLWPPCLLVSNVPHCCSSIPVHLKSCFSYLHRSETPADA
jgi:hypothetical protein